MVVAFSQQRICHKRELMKTIILGRSKRARVAIRLQGSSRFDSLADDEAAEGDDSRRAGVGHTFGQD